MRIHRLAVSACAALAGFAASASAQTLRAAWNFNSVPPDNNGATGSLMPVAGEGTLTTAGWVSFEFLGMGSTSEPGVPVGLDNSGLVLRNSPSSGTAPPNAGIEITIPAPPPDEPILHFSCRWWPGYSSHHSMRLLCTSDPTGQTGWTAARYDIHGGSAFGDADAFVALPQGATVVKLRAVSADRSDLGVPNSQTFWVLDSVKVFSLPNTAPLVQSGRFLVHAGDTPRQLYLSATDGSWDALTITGEGSPEFARNGTTLTFTPPATAPAQTTDYTYTYTATDSLGLSSSATYTVTVPGSEACPLTLTPGSTWVPCGESAVVMLTASDPPGEGGAVNYRWFFNGNLEHEGPELSFQVTGGNSRCTVTATRIGGTGDSCVPPGSPVASNEAAVVYLTSDLGVGGGAPGRDGWWDNNDLIFFIDYFFYRQPQADVGSRGGLPGPDGLYDNNDFVVFIDMFFARC